MAAARVVNVHKCKGMGSAPTSSIALVAGNRTSDLSVFYSTDNKSTRKEAKEMKLDQRAFALKLYRAILITHKRVLPPMMATFGNEYVREEWKRHKDAEPVHLKGFFEQWMNYLQELIKGSSSINSPESNDGKGHHANKEKPANTTTLENLSPEQEEQLENLREAVMEDFMLSREEESEGPDSTSR